jgi:hypothetical protein
MRRRTWLTRPRTRDPGKDAGVTADRGSPPGMPRWVKVAGIILAILALLLIVVLLVSGGHHGPGRHLSAGSVGYAPLSDGTPGLVLSRGALEAHTWPEASHRRP